MNKNLRNLFFLIILIVIPFLIYAFVQLKSLKADEKIADSIYEKQMETVLFSLNQYADDIMAQWMRKLSREDAAISKNAFDLVLGNESIQMLVLRQMNIQEDSIFPSDYAIIDTATVSAVEHWFLSKDTLIHRLENYMTAGFQKIQAADDWKHIDGLRPQQLGIITMVYDRDSTLYSALFILEPSYWADQLLGGKMYEFAQDDFRLAVLHTIKGQSEPNTIFSTTPFDLKKKYAQDDLWVLANTQLAIQPKGIAYAELIRKRSQNNLYILLFSLLVLAVGAYVILRNIRNTLQITQLKSDFVSNVSHEIRTPLSLIKMYAETLLLGRLPSEEKKLTYYEVIHNEAVRLTYLVNNILDFSKIEANKKTYRMKQANMNDLAQEMITQYSNMFEKKNVDLQVNLSPVSLPVLVDEQAFEVAMANLIENALKFSGEDKKISITTDRQKDFAFWEISDNGIGIAKEKQDKIFEKFYRIENALTQQTKGTGLGLSLVKHIVEAHQGSILVRSKPNQGTTFTIQLPLNPNSNA